MKVLGKNVIVLKQKQEYEGLIQGVSSDDTTYAKVMGIGTEVESLKIGETVVIDWNKSKKIKNDLYTILEQDVVLVVEEGDFED